MAGIKAPERPRDSSTVQASRPPQDPTNARPESRFVWLRKILTRTSAKADAPTSFVALNDESPSTPAARPIVPFAQSSDKETNVLPTVIAPKVRGNSSANTGPKGPKKEDPKIARRQERLATRAALKNSQPSPQLDAISTEPPPAIESDADIIEEREFLRTASPDEIKNVALMRLRTLIIAKTPPVILPGNVREEYSHLIDIVSASSSTEMVGAVTEIEKRLKNAGVVNAVWNEILHLDLDKLKQLPVKKRVEIAGTGRTFSFDDNNKLVLQGNALEPQPRTPGFLDFANGPLPDTVTKWERTKTTLAVTSKQLPWLKKGYELNAPLDLVTINLPNSGKTQEIYLGTAIGDSKLQEVLVDLISSKEHTQAAERVFFRDLGRHLNGDRNRTLELGRSSVPTNVASNGGKGERVYFIEPGSIDGKRVVLVIGACTKDKQQGDFASTLWGS